MAIAASPTAAVSPEAVEHPLRNPNYRRWLIGGTISLVGDQFYSVALPWLVLMQTGSPAAMGTVLMCGAIPRALLMLIGGVVSDRFSARRIMIATAIARTVCVAVVGALVAGRALHMWEIYVLAVAFGFADAFSTPASSAFLPSLIKREQMVAATSLSQSTAQLTTIAGPAPAGLIIKFFGTASAFFIDAVSFLFIIGALWTLPDPPKTHRAGTPVLKSIQEGFSYVAGDIPLRSFLVLACVLNFCITGPVGIGLPYLTKTKFGSPAVYGAVLTAVAVGALLGALLAGIWKIKRRGIMILSVFPILSLGVGAIGLVGSAWGVGALLFVVGLCAGLANVHIGAWIMGKIEPEVRGRVSSLLMLSSVGLAPISLAIAGYLIAWSLSGMFMLACAVMLVAVAFAALQKPVREIR